jgi:hypothetical protein
LIEHVALITKFDQSSAEIENKKFAVGVHYRIVRHETKTRTANTDTQLISIAMSTVNVIQYCSHVCAVIHRWLQCGPRPTTNALLKVMLAL